MFSLKNNYRENTHVTSTEVKTENTARISEALPCEPLLATASCGQEFKVGKNWRRGHRGREVTRWEATAGVGGNGQEGF